jgi:hypothetical protein
VKPDTVDSDEPPARRMLPLYFSCSIGVPERHHSVSVLEDEDGRGRQVLTAMI